jgi:hypothetical protein
MWYVLQGAIVCAVLFSNIYFQWTPNGYLAAIIALGLAFGVSWIISKAADTRHRGREDTGGLTG